MPNEQIYIGYKEVDKLLYKYPSLKALLHSIQVELERIYMELPPAELSEEDVLHAIYFARELSDMPHAAPSPGAKELNAILEKDRVMKLEWPRQLMEEKLIIGEVVAKISGALAVLSLDAKNVIDLYYWQRKRWNEIQDMIGLSPSRLGGIRQDSVNKMMPVLRVTVEQYEFCIGRVR